MNEILWYLSRASGLVSLVLLTATLVLGMLTAGRGAPIAAPASIRAGLHRTLSLVMVAFVGAHVLTAIVETYVNIGWLSLVLPFTSTYETFWVGLGTLAFDILAAVTITSLLRDRIPHRWWKLVHWTAYALWPIAVAHGLALGSADSALTVGVALTCAAAVGGSLLWRLRAVNIDAQRRRLVATQAWR